MVTVTESPNADARTVDISKYYNVTGYGFEGSEGGDIDGNGNAIPGDQMPPDGAGDMVSNPVLVGKGRAGGLPVRLLRARVTPPTTASRSTSPTPARPACNAVSCQGQRIDLPARLHQRPLCSPPRPATQPQARHSRLSGNASSTSAADDCAVDPGTHGAERRHGAQLPLPACTRAWWTQRRRASSATTRSTCPQARARSRCRPTPM